MNLLAVEATDQDFAAGTAIDLQVRAEVGAAPHGTGGRDPGVGVGDLSGNYVARALLETGGFRPQLHPGL